MGYIPSSNFLFISTCSLNKAQGGISEYDKNEFIASGCLKDFSFELLELRENIRNLIVNSKSLFWQGTELSTLEFNTYLVKGQDFGGCEKSLYMPAVYRYQGRFFQTLGEIGKEKILKSRHHMLFLSGLYGLVRPSEQIQLYGCPLKSQVAHIWEENDFITDILGQYIKNFHILRVFDLTAIAAYRNLVDWSVLLKSGVDVIHCFDVMSSGDYSLIPFAKLLKDNLLDASDDRLAGIIDDTRIENTIFRSLEVTQPGLPDDKKDLIDSDKEIPYLQTYHVSQVGEIINGGNPESGEYSSMSSEDWSIKVSSSFRRRCSRDKKIASRVLDAILEICKNPLTIRGNTMKPLEHDFKGNWRYRFGSYRIIYFPDKEKRTVQLKSLDTRDDAYS